MSAPLAPQVFSSASFTSLVRVLSDDDAAEVVALERAPFADDHTIARYERLRARWTGPKGRGERLFLLKALPNPTWSEAIRPELPAPTEVLMIEGDLSQSLTSVITDSAVAAGRRTADRPAWVLYDALPESFIDEETEADVETIHRIADGTAALHARYWNAERAVEQAYPWLPRFSEWAQAHCRFLDRLMADEPPGPYGQEALRYRPTLVKSLRRFWKAASPAQQSRLQQILHDPSPLLDATLAGPQAIINGDWRAVQMGFWEEKLVVREWSYIQYGPVAWDICTFLSASPELIDPASFMERYLASLRARVPDLDPATEQALVRTFDLVRVLDLMLSPNRWQLLEEYTRETTQSWLDTLIALLDEANV